MTIKNFIKITGIVFLVTGFYNTCLSAVAICYRVAPFLFNEISSTNKSGIGFLFISNFIFYLLLMVSGFQLLKIRRLGIWLLYVALMVFVLDGVIAGVYQETFNMLSGSVYTWVGKGLILFYLYCTKLLIPTILVIFFQYPKVVSVFKLTE